MKHLLNLLLLLSAFVFPFTTFAQTKAGEVLVYDENTPVPAHCRLIGKVKILNDGYRADCGYKQIMREARERVAKQGGNVYKITRLGKPSMWNTCYQVWGEAYYTDSLYAIKEAAAAKSDSIIQTLISDTAKYALLYIYRPRNFNGSALKYWVHADDDELCRPKNGSTCIVKIEKEGITSIWGTIETRNEHKLDVKFGEVYFIKCEIGMGVWVGRPMISIQPAKRGYTEFMKVKSEE